MSKLMTDNDVKKLQEEQQNMARLQSAALMVSEYKHRNDEGIAELIVKRDSLRDAIEELHKEQQTLQSSLRQVVMDLRNSLLPFIDQELK